MLDFKLYGLPTTIFFCMDCTLILVGKVLQAIEQVVMIIIQAFIAQPSITNGPDKPLSKLGLMSSSVGPLQFHFNPYANRIAFDSQTLGSNLSPLLLTAKTHLGSCAKKLSLISKTLESPPNQSILRLLLRCDKAQIFPYLYYSRVSSKP